METTGQQRLTPNVGAAGKRKKYNQRTAVLNLASARPVTRQRSPKPRATQAAMGDAISKTPAKNSHAATRLPRTGAIA